MPGLSCTIVSLLEERQSLLSNSKYISFTNCYFCEIRAIVVETLNKAAGSNTLGLQPCRAESFEQLYPVETITAVEPAQLFDPVLAKLSQCWDCCHSVSLSLLGFGLCCVGFLGTFCVMTHVFSQENHVWVFFCFCGSNFIWPLSGRLPYASEIVISSDKQKLGICEGGHESRNFLGVSTAKQTQTVQLAQGKQRELTTLAKKISNRFLLLFIIYIELSEQVVYRKVYMVHPRRNRTQ